MVNNNLIKHLIEGINKKDEYNKEHSKIYKIHKYWARKPWYVIEKYIKKYTCQGDLVFDPFCGSGSTGLEAIILGRDFIGYDLNPMAVMISKESTNLSFSLSAIREEFEEIRANCETFIQSLYETSVCCFSCGEKLHYKHLFVGPNYSNNKLGKTYCSSCGHRKAISVRELDQYDIEKLKEIDDMEIPFWLPKVAFPKKFYKDRFSYKGIKDVTDMHTKRNLLALSYLLDIINSGQYINKALITLAFTNTLLHTSKLKSENVRPLSVNNYWVPDDYIEENVWFRFSERMDLAIKSKKALENRINGLGKKGKAHIELKSALENSDNKKVDYVFTDPPYGDGIQYSELSFLWNAWLQNQYNINQEIVINPVQNKNEKEYDELLKIALCRIYERLNQDKYFTLCFQNKDYKVWQNVINHCKEVGFILTEVEIYDVFGSPFNKHWAKYSPKADIYVTFKKTKAPNNTITVNCDASTQDIVKHVVSYLRDNNLKIDVPLIYDITVSYIIWALYSCEGKSFDSFSIKTIVNEIEDNL